MISRPIRQGLLGISCALAALLYCSIPNYVMANGINELPPPKRDIILTVYGAITNTNVNNAAQFDRAMLKTLPHVQLKTHTSVTDGVHTFDGFLMRDLLDLVGATGSTVTATALNYYKMDFSIGEFDEYDIILAYAMDGKRLLPKHKGPLWIVYPRDDYPELQDIRYDYRWVWQLIRLDVL